MLVSRPPRPAAAAALGPHQRDRPHPSRARPGMQRAAAWIRGLQPGTWGCSLDTWVAAWCVGLQPGYVGLQPPMHRGASGSRDLGAFQPRLRLRLRRGAPLAELAQPRGRRGWRVTTLRVRLSLNRAGEREGMRRCCGRRQGRQRLEPGSESRCCRLRLCRRPRCRRHSRQRRRQRERLRLRPRLRPA